MILAGIDYSINCPSICIYDDTKQFSFENCIFYVNQYNVSKKEINRRKKLKLENIFFLNRTKTDDNLSKYIILAEQSINVLKEHNVEVVGMEGYALGAKGLIFNIAECTAILKFLLTKNGIKYIVFPPSEVKKTFTSKGNANKEKMVDKFNEMSNIYIEQIVGIPKEKSPVSDIVDSFAMVHNYLNKGINYENI